MKKVHTPQNVAHLWANQLQDEARNSGGNFYFENKTIYSYGRHFPIACLTGENNNIVLFTTQGYSKTTSEHLHIVRAAASHKEFIYCFNPYSALCGNHTENLEQFKKEAEQIASNLQKAKKPEIYLNQLGVINSRVIAYTNLFNISIPASLLAILSIGNKYEYLQYNEQKEALLKAENERKQKELKKQLTKELKDWRKFERPSLYVRNGFDFLRYNSEKKRVETSQRVEIPVEIAKNTYYHIKETIKTGGCVDCGETKVLDYTISEINNKFVKIGCHTIEIKEIEKIAKLLNW